MRNHHDEQGRRTPEVGAPLGFLAGLLLFAVIVAMGHCQTCVRQFPEMTIVRRGNFVIGATTDGFLCYGTHEPLETFCHKAVPKVLYAGK